MKCTGCGGSVWDVINTRQREGYIYRRRACLICGKRMTTREIPYEEDGDKIDHSEMLLSLAEELEGLVKKTLGSILNGEDSDERSDL